MDLLGPSQVTPLLAPLYTHDPDPTQTPDLERLDGERVAGAIVYLQHSTPLDVTNFLKTKVHQTGAAYK